MAEHPRPVSPFVLAGQTTSELMDRLFPNWQQGKADPGPLRRTEAQREEPPQGWPPQTELTSDDLRFGADGVCLRLLAYWLHLQRVFR